MVGGRTPAERGFELLHAVAFEVGREMDPQRLADLAVERARIALEVDTASLMWWDPEEGVLRRMARSKLGRLPGPETDFGTGYSSLARLGQLPVDEIKLDRSFVAATGEPRGRAIARSVIELGNASGLRVVAEGVEQQETWIILRALGCDFAQGFLIGRPAPPEDLAGRADRARNDVA